MQTIKPVTVEQMDTFFKKALKDAVELGINPRNSEMLDIDTLEAIWAISRAYPKTDVELVQKARAAWQSELDWLRSDRYRALLAGL